MLKKVFLILIFLISSIFYVNATFVDIKTNVYNDYTIFTYEFNFSANSIPNSFSIEKPKGAKLELAKSGNLNIQYVTAGDFFIFKNSNEKYNNIIVKFKSYSSSQNIIDSDSFSTYINFNFPIDKLKFEINFKDNFGKILEVFPRNYESKTRSNYVWIINDVKKDTLFLINFEPKNKKNIITNENFLKKYFTQIIIFVLIFIATILFIFVKRYLKKTNKKEIKNNLNKIEEEIELLKGETNENNNNFEKKENENIETFKEILNKYLTDNEKEIVYLIKDNQGILQNDILNHLPTLTKSNLSKILSKLNSKKILNKVKVGKVNKIYLGGKFDNIIEKNED